MSQRFSTCRALDREDLIEDPRFKTATDRFANAEERKQITAREIEKWASDEILTRLDSEGVPCAPLLTRMELMGHDQIIANDSIQKIEYPGFGEVREPRPAARFDKTPAEIQGPAPRLGQNSQAVLERLGYTGAQIQALVESNKVLVSD